MTIGASQISDADLIVAHRLADIATRTAMRYFGRNVPQEAKWDGSPATEADLTVEELLLGVLRRECPAGLVLSKERGEIVRGRQRWILDPIDGIDMLGARVLDGQATDNVPRSFFGT